MNGLSRLTQSGPLPSPASLVQLPSSRLSAKVIGTSVGRRTSGPPIKSNATTRLWSVRTVLKLKPRSPGWKGESGVSRISRIVWAAPWCSHRLQWRTTCAGREPENQLRLRREWDPDPDHVDRVSRETTKSHCVRPNHAADSACAQSSRTATRNQRTFLRSGRVKSFTTGVIGETNDVIQRRVPTTDL